MTTSPPLDDLAELLTPQPCSPSVLRESLLRRTERQLVRARRLRRSAQVAAVAAVFLVGGATGWFARPERERVIEVAGAEHIVTVPVPVPVYPEANASGSPKIEPPLSASKIEMQAELADGMEAAKLYRTAGDTFLDNQDYPNAARCYRLYLIHAGDNGLSLEPSDTWLLTSMKNNAFTEKLNVAKTDG